LPSSQKLYKQLYHRFWLFLLHPMTGAVNQVNAFHLSTSSLLHAFECAGCLINAPVTLPTYEHLRNIDSAVCEQLELGVVLGRQPDAVRLRFWYGRPHS
jgi:hypothetical protein